MAHEITNTEGMVSGMGIVPWHGLGTVIEGRLSGAAAIEAANLGWEVRQEPVYDGDMVEIPTHQINRRSDNGHVLGVVSKDWTPVQNTFLVEIAEALAQSGMTYEAVVETAGSLRGGRIVWALISTGLRQFYGSDHKAYLLLSNSHDGSRAVRGTMTDVRVVCNNTLTFAEASRASLMVRHSKNVQQNLNRAIGLLGWANDATDATFAIYDALAATAMNVDRVLPVYQRLVTEHLGFKEDSPRIGETVDEMIDLFRSGAGNEGRTAFDALTGVTDWVDHHRKYNKGDDVEERRFLYSTLGGGAEIKKAAMKLLQAV